MNLGILAVLFSSGYAVSAITEYLYISEDAHEGFSYNPDNKNAFDSAYNEIIEEDLYEDLNNTFCDNDITYGSLITGTVPDSMYTDDGVIVQYSEETLNTEDFYDYLVPNADLLTGFDYTNPTSPTDHYSKVDEGVTYDGNGSYNEAQTSGDKDAYGFTASTWDGVGSPNIELSIGFSSMKEADQPASISMGYYIGSTDYWVFTDDPRAFAYDGFILVSSGETLNPATSAEWTLSDINGIGVYFTATDANPDIRLTTVVIEVFYNFVDNYALEISHTYYDNTYHPEGTYIQEIECNLWGSTTPNFKMYVYDNDLDAWNEIYTFTGITTAFVTFTVYEEYINASGDIVIRFADTDRVGDTIRSSISIDYFNIITERIGYDASVSVWYFEVPISEPTISFNGYVESGEYGYTFSLYNYTSDGIDFWFNLTETEPVWHNLSMSYTNQFNGGMAEVLIDENVATIGDVNRLSVFVDYMAILVDTGNEPPEFTSTVPDATIHNNTAYSYDANATDPEDDEIIYDLEGNITEWATINPTTGVVSGTPTEIGTYWMNISIDDSVNPLVWQNTSLTVFSDAPVITSSPETEAVSNETYAYDCDASDYENEDLTFTLAGNITGWATINPSTGVVSGTPTIPGSYWMNITVTDGTGFDYQNTEITVAESEPEVPPPSEGLSTNQVVIFVLICLFLAIILIWGIGVFD
jgi:hypothetical protein